MKRFNFIILLVFFASGCKAQIYEELKGCWLPEKFVLSVVQKDTANVAGTLFPIKGLEIIKQKSRQFVHTYAEDLNNRDSLNVDDIILAVTYCSELNMFTDKKVMHEGKSKYKIVNLYRGLNLSHVAPEAVERIKSSDVYISKSGDKLLLEIIGRGRRDKIFFVDRVDGYTFENIEDSMEHLKGMYNYKLIAVRISE